MSMYPNSRLRPGSGEYLKAHLQSGMTTETACAYNQAVDLTRDRPERSPAKNEEIQSHERQEDSTEPRPKLQCSPRLVALVSKIVGNTVSNTVSESGEGREDSPGSVIVRPRESSKPAPVSKKSDSPDNRRSSTLNPVDSSDDSIPSGAESALSTTPRPDADNSVISRKLEYGP